MKTKPWRWSANLPDWKLKKLRIDIEDMKKEADEINVHFK